MGAPPKPSGETCTPRTMICAAAIRNPLPLEYHDAVDAAGRGRRYGEQRLAAKVRELDLLVAVEVPRGLDAGDRRQHQIGLLPGKDVDVDPIALGSSDAPAARGDGPGARAVDRIAMGAQPRTDCLQPLHELRLHL